MSRDARRANEARFTATARQYVASGIAERHAQHEALRRLAAPAQDDALLDVACGPGALLEAFGPLVRCAVGLDLTMAMLAEARRRRREGGRLFLVRGEAERLPFGDGAFSLVVSTWAVHHFGDPRRVLDEMVRVCRSGGRVAVGDLVGSEDDGKRALQNEIERLRDPAHVEMLSAGGLQRLLASAGLAPAGRAGGELMRDLDEWCRISGTPPEAARRVRRMLLDTQPGDLAGMAPAAQGDRVRFVHRWAIATGRKP
jgi:SAM-dependent methyltransferase